MNSDLLFFRLAALKSLAVASAMPTFFALLAKKNSGVIFSQILNWQTIDVNMSKYLEMATMENVPSNLQTHSGMRIFVLGISDN